MGQTLTQIAETLRGTEKKVQLIYAFNGSGKTRLSRAFKEQIDFDDESEEQTAQRKFLYYSAFTEDLFFWKNKSEENLEYKLSIQPNEFLDWILNFQGEEGIATNFQHFTNKKLTPSFPPVVKQITNAEGRRENRNTYPEVRFSYGGGGDMEENVKISKGEESNFIWSIFYTLIQEVVALLEEADPEKRSDNQFDELEYIFIDDPVSSLDENHLIELAINLAGLIKRSPFRMGCKLKFIITTHSPLFYNVLCKELSSAKRYFFEQQKDGSFELVPKKGSANKSFSYHHHLRQTLEAAIATSSVEKYHFNLLRNLYEKTAHFLGYSHWTTLLGTLPDERCAYFRKVTNHFSHRSLSSEEAPQPTQQQKDDINILLENLIDNYGYWQEEAPNG